MIFFYILNEAVKSFYYLSQILQIIFKDKKEVHNFYIIITIIRSEPIPPTNQEDTTVNSYI